MELGRLLRRHRPRPPAPATPARTAQAIAHYCRLRQSQPLGEYAIPMALGSASGIMKAAVQISLHHL
jgi:hypothetical protein